MVGKPRSFSWVIEGRIAAMGRPASVRRDLEYLYDQGIRVIIGLTTRPLQECFLDEFGFHYHHIPMADFSPPTPEQIDEFVGSVEAARASGQRVAVHCLAGLGRTGTMIACYLVHQGHTAREAIEEIRRLRPGSVETVTQEAAIGEYERRHRSRGCG